MAQGDFNNDGVADALIAVNDGEPVLLKTNFGRENHWLEFRLIGKKANIDAVSSKITYKSGDLKRQRSIVAGGSYLSAHDPRVVLGIGQRTKIEWLEIKWPEPSGRVERLTDLPIDRYVSIMEGEGKWK